MPLVIQNINISLFIFRIQSILHSSDIYVISMLAVKAFVTNVSPIVNFVEAVCVCQSLIKSQ